MTAPLLITTKHPNPVEDIPEFTPHAFVQQARTFMRNGTHPHLFYQAVARSLPQVPGVENKDAMLLLAAIEDRYVNLVNSALLASNTARANKDVKATKPADIYRKYAKDLRAIWKRGAQTSEAAHLLLVDLELELTLSWGDLETPDYLDGYTQEPIIDTEDPHEFIDKLIQHNRGISFETIIAKLGEWAESDGFTGKASYKLVSGLGQELLLQAERCRKELGWGDQEVTAFLEAQGAFDAESDDEPDEYDDNDTYTPPTLEEKELKIDRQLWSEARDDVWSFNAARKRIFEELAVTFKNMSKKQKRAASWHGMFRAKLLEQCAFQAVINQIVRIAREDIVTAAALYLSLAGDYGLIPEDVCDIRGTLPNGAEAFWMNMLDFADAWEDDLLSIQQDSLHKSSPMSESKIEEFSQKTLDDIAATMPKYDPNPVKTASWNIGNILAMLGGADLKAAESAAWDAWRLAMDPTAAKAYNETLAATGSRTKAMAAFWRACDKRVPRPQEKIKSFTIKGLKLESGREINWWLAGVKIRQNELDLNGDIKPRLLKALQEKGVGQAIWELLK